MSGSASLREAFRRRFGREPRVARAPGRVNLIGEHTDYNDGLVLPAAIDAYVDLAFSAGTGGTLRGYSIALDREGIARLDALEPVAEPEWVDYAAGVAWAFRESGREIPGMDFVVGGTLPMGAGLSSSAALELAVARALVELGGDPWDGRLAAALAHRAETDYVGMPCGIMDQRVVALAEPGTAMLLDCRSLGHDAVPVPESWRIVVMDTGTRRGLAGSAYAERRAACERAAAALGVAALRDASRADLDRASSRLDPAAFRRALHVIEENDRVAAMARAFPVADASRVGELMAASHASLRDLFEVSTPALDRMVELAVRHPACLGARMTGGGFGGSAVALVEAEGASRFASEIGSAYRETTGEAGELTVRRAVGGVELLE